MLLAHRNEWGDAICCVVVVPTRRAEAIGLRGDVGTTAIVCCVVADQRSDRVPSTSNFPPRFLRGAVEAKISGLIGVLLLA